MATPSAGNIVTKPGYKTTEFWLTVGGVTLASAAGVVAIIPGVVAASIAGGLTGLYNILRAVQKLRDTRTVATESKENHGE